MARTPVRDGQFAGFAGGVNRTADPFALANDQLRQAKNIRVSRIGGILKRDGGYVYAADDAPTTSGVTGGFMSRSAEGDYILLVDAGGLYTSELDGMDAWDNPTITLSTNAKARFAQFIDGAGDEVVYIADGGLLNKWACATGTATADIASTPSCTVLKVHNQRLYGAGDPAAPDSLFYSALNNGDTLGIGASQGGQIVVRTFGDSKILALASYRESLYIFHEQGISRLTGFGQDDTEVSPEGVSGVIGIMAIDSIVETDDGVYFVTSQGVFIVNDGGVQRLGSASRPDPVAEYIAATPTVEGFTILGAYSRRTSEVMVSIFGHGTYVLNLITRTWTGPWDGPWSRLMVMVEAVESSQSVVREALLGVTTEDFLTNVITILDVPEYIRDDSTYGDITTGTNFTLTAQFRRADFGDVTTSKSLRWGFFTGYFPANSDVTVAWETDRTAAQYTLSTPPGGIWDDELDWDETLVWGPAGYRQYRIPMCKNGYFVDVIITDGNAFRTEISRFVMDAYTLGIR